jgi:hypothetical protein
MWPLPLSTSALAVTLPDWADTKMFPVPLALITLLIVMLPVTVSITIDPSPAVVITES